MHPTEHRRSVLYSQNFLREPRLVEYLLNAASIGADDTVYEIGPGEGIITERLARRCRSVVAVEKDPLLAGPLRRRFADRPGVVVAEADFLDFPLPDEEYKVFANVPFSITTAVVTKLTTAAHPPEDSYLIVQREAAQRFLGEPVESLYAVLLKPWFEPSILYHFRPGDFAPAPRVDVVMLRLRKRGPPLVSAREAQSYRDFVVHAFTAPRPNLRGALRRLFGRREFDEIGRRLELKRDTIPSGVSFERWLTLYYCYTLLATPATKQEVEGAERRLRERQQGLEKMHRTRVASTGRGIGR